MYGEFTSILINVNVKKYTMAIFVINSKPEKCRGNIFWFQFIWVDTEKEIILSEL